MNIMVYDIETIPDIKNSKKIFNIDNISDEEIIKTILKKQNKNSTNSDFLPHYLQRIIVISIILKVKDNFKILSFNTSDFHEKDLIKKFYENLETFHPTIISWNGNKFDLPVIHYRSLLHGISSKIYWDTGYLNYQFKWNNYLNRFHNKHIDLMDILSKHQIQAYASLDNISLFLNFPGKMGFEGNLVYNKFKDGKIKDISNYCETDVLNTYLIFLRFQLIRNILNKKEYIQECINLKNYLINEKKKHLDTFLNNWKKKHTNNK